jgi:hypothetical protein
MPDEIIKELWRVKDQAAQEANYNMQERCRQLLEREGKSSAAVVNLSKKRHRPVKAARKQVKTTKNIENCEAAI